MPRAKKPKVPPSPLTGLYLVRNSGGVYLRRGNYADCVQFAARYAADRRSQGRPPDETQVLPERLWVKAREIRRLLPAVDLPSSQFAVEATQARPTGNRTEQWWGGMDGGPTQFEEWEATLGDAVPSVAGRRFRCYRGGTSELDRSPSGYLTAIEVLA